MFSSASMGWGWDQSRLSEFQSMSTIPHRAAQCASTYIIIYIIICHKS